MNWLRKFFEVVTGDESSKKVREALEIAQTANRWGEVEEILQEVLLQNPKCVEAKFQLACLWTREMRNKYNVGSVSTREVKTKPIEEVFQSVDQLLQSVIQVSPHHPGPHYCYACWASFPFKESYSEMKKSYTKALELDEYSDSQYYIFHSDVAYEASKDDIYFATEAYYWAHKTGKEDGDTRPGNNVAFAAWRQGRERWIKENPKEAGIYDELTSDGRYFYKY